ncbi:MULTISPECIES: sensor histidine kinase [unclassified Spirillospora]|uniref:sensor histidine kinase n=1 Tax=unclassified Spirillospora TaxID=2642701 RepID=UPI003719969F
MTTEWREGVRSWWARLLFSVRGRATVITVAVSALILALAFILLMVLARDWAENRVWRTSERTVERIVYDIVLEKDGQILATRPGETSLVQIVNPEGRVVAATPALRGRRALARSEVTAGKLLVDGRYCPDFLDECVWVFGLRVRESRWGPGVMVIAATPLPGLLNLVVLPLSIALVAAGLLALIAWWTWHTIGRVFVPVDQIRAGMAAFSAKGLGHRVPVPQNGGEIQSLAETVNTTLAQLEEARVRERRFISDASHDLRNPIAGLQMQLELALDEPDGGDWKPMVRSALYDTQRLNDIIIDLLELSRLDARAPAAAESIDLAGLARREVERRHSRVPIETRLERDVIVRANPVRLTRVLNNLLSNAERHAESRIEVTVARTGADAVLQVLDDGAGVPEESRERVFERFARLSASRTRDPEGTGLGLPIAREIAEIYGGSLRIADSPRGARFVLRLPLAAWHATP